MNKLLFLSLLSFGFTQELWEYHQLPEIFNVTLTKEQPLDINETWTKLQLTDIGGILYADSFSKLTKVTDLKLLAKHLQEVEPGALCSAPNLKTLELMLVSKPKFPKLLKSHFENCNHLEKLSLTGDYENPTPIDKDTLQNVFNIKTLALSQLNIPHLTRDYFKKLKSLVHLSIRKCDVRKMDPDAFEDLKELKEVEIYFNEIVTLPKKLFKNSPKLERLLLISNNITGLTWDEFEGLDSLKELHIGRNQITAFDADKIAKNMPNLRVFTFELNPVDCKTREAFANELKAKLNHSIDIEHKFDPGFYDSCEVIN